VASPRATPKINRVLLAAKDLKEHWEVTPPNSTKGGDLLIGA